MTAAAAAVYEDAWGDDEGASALLTLHTTVRTGQHMGMKINTSFVQSMRHRHWCARRAEAVQQLKVCCKHSNACIAPSKPQLVAEPTVELAQAHIPFMHTA